MHGARAARSALRSAGFGTVVSNASALVGSTLVASGVGAVYWWAAARFFTPADVGLASALISATTLLGAASLLGTGTLLIGELARRSVLERSRLVATALAVSGSVGGLLGVGFALAAPRLAQDLAPIGGSLEAVTLFGLTVALTAAGGVVDHALVGLLRAKLQLTRNALMAIAKLGVLGVVAVMPFGDRSLAIYFSWFVGTLVSFAAVVHVAGLGRLPVSAYRPQWGLLRRLGRPALQHHALNLSLQAPSLLMPLVVTTLLSATANAYFYLASMFAMLVFIIPTALASALYAAGSHAPATFARKLRLSVGLSFVAGVAANLFLLVAASTLLGLFGRAYAEEAAWVLQVQVLGVFPGIVKSHFVAVYQTRRRVGRAAVISALGGVLELGGAAFGASIGGLHGLVVGYVAALGVEALVVAPTVIRALLHNRDMPALPLDPDRAKNGSQGIELSSPERVDHAR